jgi:hypothetical protein
VRTIRLQGRSSKGKKLIREVGHEWMLLERHDAYLVVSPVTRPDELRTVLSRRDPNLYLESPLPDES